MWAAMVQGLDATLIAMLLAVVLIAFPSVPTVLVAKILVTPAAGFVVLAGGTSFLIT